MSKAVAKSSSLNMRSAVSAILSEPSEASSMAFPDYAQTAADHRRGLILVLPVGSRLNQPSFQRIRDRITSVGKVYVPPGAARDPGNGVDLNPETPPRVFRVRYANSHPLETNEWGDFQMHRSLLGLVCVGGYGTPQELCELSRIHDVAKSKYSKTVLDTRLIAIGVSSNDNHTNGSDNNDKIVNDDDIFTNGSSNDGLVLPQIETNQNGLNNGGQPASTTVLFYQSRDFEETLEADLVDFVTGLFWILESQRREIQKNGNDKLPFYCAPFERKDFVGLDLESRTNKKRTYGRHRKHLGDLGLLCDMPLEALAHYESAAEILRSCNDWIWLAGALEGLCSIAVMVLYPSLNKRPLLATRNPSYDTFSAFKKKLSMDEAPLLLPPSKVLKASDVIEKYKECVVHYSKYRHAGVIETEASIKAVRVLTEQCNYLLAAEFLQNIVFINLQMNDEEKIQRFTALAKLYGDIGFKRKAAFFLRVAAMRCVAPQNPHPDWSLCYSLLLKATPGYYLDLTQTVALKTRYIGWPDLQIQLLQEMVGTARRMGHHTASTRHMTYLLEVLFDHLSESEKADFSQQLSVLTSRSVGNDSPISLDGLGGLILPPVPMYKIPKISSFTLCPLASHLVPRPKAGHRKNKESVFVFTPINFGGKEDSSKINFQWVANDVAEVCLTLFNPLPTEVKLVGLALLHEGIEFENFPSTLSLAPNSGPHTVSLLGVPKEAGELKILGYTFTVLGVQSTCRLRGTKGQTIDYTIQVLPSLPQLDASLKRVDSEAVEQDEMLRLYLGEEASYECHFTNISNIKADNVTMSFSTDPKDMKEMVSLKGLIDLELEPGESSKVKLDVKGIKLMFNNTFQICDDDLSLTSVMSRQETTRWSGASASDSASNSVKRPSFVSIEVKLTYYGGDGGSSGYLRELTRSLKVDICPSASVTKWDVLPAEVLNENYLVLDISNQSIHEMELEYGPQKKTLSMEPQDECRIPLPVSKFPQRPKDNLKARQKACSDHLAKTVHIQWCLPRLNNRLGLVSLKDIKLDEDMISSLELCPLEWRLSMNGVTDEVISGPQNMGLGEEFTLDLSVSNHFDFPVDGTFKVEVLLDESPTSFEAASEVLIVQSQPESATSVCQPGGLICHSTAILPLSSGTYDVICSCSIVKHNAHESGEETPFHFVSKYPKIVVNINE